MNILEGQFSKGFFATLNNQRSDHSLVSFAKPVQLQCLRFYPEHASIKLANTVIQSETMLGGESSGSILVYAKDAQEWKLIDQFSIAGIKQGVSVALRAPLTTSRIMIRAPKLNISFLVCYQEISEPQTTDVNLLNDDSVFSGVSNKILNKKFPYLDRLSEPLCNYVHPVAQNSIPLDNKEKTVKLDKAKEIIDDLEKRKLKPGVNRKAKKMVKWLKEHSWKLIRDFQHCKNVI